MIVPGSRSPPVVWCHGLGLLLGMYMFAVQFYCDFSCFSGIASGVATLMVFRLMENFNFPYFATSNTDFWRRWHISLSEWLRDYVYIPLGGNRIGKMDTYRNLLLAMLLGGLWLNTEAYRSFLSDLRKDFDFLLLDFLNQGFSKTTISSMQTI